MTDPDIWTRLQRHRRRWEKVYATLDELREERLALVKEAATSAPLTLIGQTLGISRERVSAMLRSEK